MWQDNMTTILRVSINDVDDPQTYSDSRLQLALIVGAFQVNTEFNFAADYTININQFSIHPDPTAGSSPDGWFINLTVMKSALSILSNDLKLASLQAWKIRDIDVDIDLREVAQVKKQLYDEAYKYYEWAGMQYRVGVYCSMQAILTPFNILAGNMRGGNYGWGQTDRDRVVW